MILGFVDRFAMKRRCEQTERVCPGLGNSSPYRLSTKTICGNAKFMTAHVSSGLDYCACFLWFGLLRSWQSKRTTDCMQLKWHSTGLPKTFLKCVGLENWFRWFQSVVGQLLVLGVLVVQSTSNMRTQFHRMRELARRMVPQLLTGDLSSMELSRKGMQKKNNP